MKLSGIRQAEKFQNIRRFQNVLSRDRLALQPFPCGWEQTGFAAVGYNALVIGRMDLPLKLGLAPATFNRLLFIEQASPIVLNPYQGTIVRPGGEGRKALWEFATRWVANSIEPIWINQIELSEIL